MAQVDFPREIRSLIGELKRLPGVGPRSAERMAVWIMREAREVPMALADAIRSARDAVTSCPACGFYAGAEEGCAICRDPRRDPSVLCVVEQVTDILPIERSGAYTGQYHVLGGRLSPLDGVGPEDLRIAELVARVKGGEFAEIILGMGSDVEGDATAHYIVEMLHPLVTTVTRLAQGLPAGGGLEHADALTLSRALSGRRSV